MLISYSVKNWGPFREEVTLNMIATQERQHRDRLRSSKIVSKPILPIAALFGPNGSGKTSLVESLRFAQEFIVSGTSGPSSHIDVVPFAFDDYSEKNPSEFTFVVDVGGRVFKYFFSVDSSRVYEESLYEIKRTVTKEYFHRTENDEYLFYPEQFGDEQMARFRSEATRPNMLYLTSSVQQNNTDLSGIYSWFERSLIIIGTDSIYSKIEELVVGPNAFCQKTNHFLRRSDTGISQLLVDKAQEIKELSSDKELLEKLQNGETLSVALADGNRAILRSNKGTVEASIMKAVHIGADGKQYQLSLDLESEGTRRLIELLPALYCPLDPAPPRTFVIDELDRSLHTNLSKELVRSFLEGDHNATAQLIFTCHDVMLLDQSLLRRDEMWFVDRKQNESATLISISDFEDVRADTDIRRSYVVGRMGGVPSIN